MSSNWKTAVLVGGTAAVCTLALKFASSCDIQNNKQVNQYVINNVLIYGRHDEAEKRVNADNENLTILNYVITQTTTSLDVCMPSVTSTNLIHTLVHLARKGIKIRAVIHRDRTKLQFLFLEGLVNCGVQIKMIGSKEKLEHEFILIDSVKLEPFNKGVTVALIGALNFPPYNTDYQKDNTLITSEKAIVAKFKLEFNRIWDEYLECDLATIVKDTR